MEVPRDHGGHPALIPSDRGFCWEGRAVRGGVGACFSDGASGQLPCRLGPRDIRGAGIVEGFAVRFTMWFLSQRPPLSTCFIL